MMSVVPIRMFVIHSTFITLDESERVVLCGG